MTFQCQSRQMAYPNDPESVGAARQMVERFAYEAGGVAQDVADLVSAVGEALANAAEHGYRPKTQIFVRCSIAAQRLVVEVEDEGPGFSPAGSRDKKRPDARGNGLTIMMCLVDDVSFEKNGRVVRLEKAL